MQLERPRKLLDGELHRRPLVESQMRLARALPALEVVGIDLVGHHRVLRRLPEVALLPELERRCGAVAKIRDPGGVESHLVRVRVRVRARVRARVRVRVRARVRAECSGVTSEG